MAQDDFEAECLSMSLHTVTGLVLWIAFFGTNYIIGQSVLEGRLGEYECLSMS